MLQKHQLSLLLSAIVIAIKQRKKIPLYAQLSVIVLMFFPKVQASGNKCLKQRIRCILIVSEGMCGKTAVMDVTSLLSQLKHWGGIIKDTVWVNKKSAEVNKAYTMQWNTVEKHFRSFSNYMHLVSCISKMVSDHINTATGWLFELSKYFLTFSVSGALIVEIILQSTPYLTDSLISPTNHDRKTLALKQ